MGDVSSELNEHMHPPLSLFFLILFVYTVQVVKSSDSLYFRRNRLLLLECMARNALLGPFVDLLKRIRNSEMNLQKKDPKTSAGHFQTVYRSLEFLLVL